MGARALAPLVLTLSLAAIPASGATILLPDLVDRAVALEKEGLKRATPEVTSQLAERLNGAEDLPPVVGWTHIFIAPDESRLVFWLGSDEPRVRVTPTEVAVEYPTPGGTVRRSVRLDPTHTYLALEFWTPGLRTVPVEPVHAGEELPVLIIHGGRIFEPATHLPPSAALETTMVSIIPLTRAVEFMDPYDLLVRVELEDETVAFDLVRSDGLNAYRVICDLRTGGAWRARLPPGQARELLELTSEDLARLSQVGSAGGGPGLWLILYDVTEGRILLELARPSLGFLRECSPRLAGLAELLKSIDGVERLLSWNFLRLSALARGLRNLLEVTGLAGTELVRPLLNPGLLQGAYLLASGVGLATSLAWIELLERLPRLGEAPEFRWDLASVLEYAARLAYVGILHCLGGILWAVGDRVARWLLGLLGLGDQVSSRVLDVVEGSVWAPLIEEPAKRLVGELSGLPLPLVGAWYGLLEAAIKGELWPLEWRAVVDRVSNHVLYAVAPLPIGTLLHSLTNVTCDFGNEFPRYWVGVLGPALATLGALVESRLMGLG